MVLDVVLHVPVDEARDGVNVATPGIEPVVEHILGLEVGGHSHSHSHRYSTATAAASTQPQPTAQNCRATAWLQHRHSTATHRHSTVTAQSKHRHSTGTVESWHCTDQRGVLEHPDQHEVPRPEAVRPVDVNRAYHRIYSTNLRNQRPMRRKESRTHHACVPRGAYRVRTWG